MPRRHKRSKDWLFPKAAIETDADTHSSLLDVVDSVLNKGAVVNGELVLGLANVDLIYAKLSVLLSALDRVVGDEGSRRGHEDPPRKRGEPRRRREHSRRRASSKRRSAKNTKRT